MVLLAFVAAAAAAAASFLSLYSVFYWLLKDVKGEKHQPLSLAWLAAEAERL